MYHSIGTSLAHDSYGISLPRDVFTDHVHRLSKEWTVVPMTVETFRKPVAELTVGITFDDGYQDNLWAAEVLTQYHMPFTIFVSSDMVNQPGYLTTDQMLQLANNPLCTIGAHGKSHCRISECSDEEQTAEVDGCKNELESMISKPVTTMSFPHGDFDDQVIAKVQKAGYELAFTSIEGLNESPVMDRFRIRRTEIINGDDADILAKKVLGFNDFMYWKHAVKQWI